MKYYNNSKLKTELLKETKNKTERNFIKEHFSVPLNGECAIKHKDPVAFGYSFSIGFSEKTIKRSFPDLDLDKYDFCSINDKNIKEKLVIDNIKSLFDNLNKSRSKLNKKTEKLKLTEEQKQVKKENRIKKGLNFIKKAEELLNNNSSILIFDIEAYEHDQKKITEIGFLSIINSRQIIKHLIIKENIDLLNGQYVSENKFNFNYGESNVLPLKECFNILINEILKHEALMGQNIASDIKYLNKYLSKELDNQELINNKINSKVILDTATMSLYLSEDANHMSIERSLDKLGLETKNLHNAGNDSFYTMILAKSLIDYKNTIELLLNKQSHNNNKITKKTNNRIKLK